MNDTLRAQPSRLLLALPARGLPTATLLRALSLSRVLGAELHVLRVSPPPRWSSPVFPHLNGLKALVTMSAQHELLEATRDWLEDLTGGGFEVARLEAREGDFWDEVAARADELGAALIVLPDLEGAFGAKIAALARAARVPVLVGRAPAKSEVIVAASDLRDDDYPVLRRASALGAALRSEVVAVHNVAPATAPLGHEVSWVTALEAADVLSAARLAQLERASARLGAELEPVVTRGPRAGEAVVELARERDADVVVVGTREQPPFASLFRADVAAQVIERSPRSVLVLPLDGALDKPPLAS